MSMFNEKPEYQMIVEQKYWDDSYSLLPLKYDESSIEFKVLLDRFIPRGGTCFEPGCYPGNYMTYFYQRFGYTVSGIDTTPHVRDRLPSFLKFLGVRVGDLFFGDFMDFKSERQYDLVYSNGFIEHFVNFEAVMHKHIDLVKRGGILMISTPNLRRMQFVLHWILDRQNLNRHVLSAMNLEAWRTVLEERGMELLYHGYYGTWKFWTDSVQGHMMKSLAWCVQTTAKYVDYCVNWPNPWLSPYLVSITRKIR